WGLPATGVIYGEHEGLILRSMKFIFFFSEVPKLCRMEADGGPCRSHLRRYAFNLSSMRCEEFIYGGCYGNGNNFRDLQSCVDHCLPEKSNAGPLLCYSPKDEGLCSSSVPRYYYDTKTKSCKEFKYTGCGGNANNFVTEKDCYNVCRKGKIFCILSVTKREKHNYMLIPRALRKRTQHNILKNDTNEEKKIKTISSMYIVFGTKLKSRKVALF
uniref:Tissue factor pathway inhibitor 2 n=1 Tax=Bubo bubo TaxID=30461 RepID=A0A8C0FQF1_BUBBB